MLEKFVEEEFKALSLKYNTEAVTGKCVLHFEDKRFFESFMETVTVNRRGEVGFLLKRKNGKYVIIRSRKYPAEVLRIPTGGIGFDETAEEALFREVREELGVSFLVSSFVGLLEYEIHHGEEIVKFYSFLFELSETGGEILKDATQDEISSIRECTCEELVQTGERLASNKGSWKDWCRFRAQLIGFYGEYISKIGGANE